MWSRGLDYRGIIVPSFFSTEGPSTGGTHLELLYAVPCKYFVYFISATKKPREKELP